MLRDIYSRIRIISINFMAKKTKLPAKVVKHLEKLGIKHEILEHKTVYTAIDAAATMGRELKEIVKALLVKADKDYYIILIPADYNLDFEKLIKVLSKQNNKKIKVVKIPGEKIMEKALKIKAGAVSAFGSLHKLPVVVDKKLTSLKKAVFPGGGFHHSIEMAVEDFIKAEKAILGNLGVKKKIKKPKAVKAKAVGVKKAVKKKMVSRKKSVKK